MTMAKKKSVLKKIGNLGTGEIKNRISGEKIKENIKRIGKIKLMKVVQYCLNFYFSISVGWLGRLFDIHLYIAQIRTSFIILIIALLPVLLYMINSNEK